MENQLNENKEEELKNTNTSKKGFLPGLLVGMLAGMLLLSCVFMGIRIFQYYQTKNSTGEDGTEAESVINSDTLSKMQTIENLIKETYYGDEVTTGQLMDGVYKGMVDSLDDPYSEYYTKEELEEVMNSNQGVSYGIGAYISLDQTRQLPVISGLVEDSPASEAGIKEGDIIYKVGDEYTQGLSLTEVVSLVKGLEGTTVHLTMYREGEPDYLEFDIERSSQIETTTVDYGMIEGEDSVGYLRIREFDTVTVDQYTEAMAELNAKGMKGLILDLRSNPGGDLNVVVEIARKILPAGLIVYTEDKEGNRKEYTCDGTNELQIPLVVLTNEYSASASEILAGAIQDYNKGTLVGTTTYGKGIVQSIRHLSDGTALKLTTSAYFTPSGRNIHGVGITPDIEVEMDYDQYYEDGTDTQFDKALEILEGKME